MFNPEMTVAAINQMGEQTLAANLGIEFTEVGADFMCARMPVDSRTIQPFGLLHGGASIALAETMGSVASTALIDLTTQAAVGLDINGNHLRTRAGRALSAERCGQFTLAGERMCGRSASRMKKGG